MARGLGLLRLVTNLLHSYDAAGSNLIVVVGADERENGWIGEGTLGARGTETDCWQLIQCSVSGACCCEQVAAGERAEPSQHRYDECGH